jgi:4-amino-4-deoxy-L-arabinose transferase-like glycosyltransferase
MITREFKNKIWLFLVLVLAALMNLLKIKQEDFANLYYSASIRSMLMNVHNFFFVSFDPGGFISVDKPPLGFWIQTFSARIFGFYGWSIILPQALAGIISVAIIYTLVKRHWGSRAGLLAALAQALMPIAVAANRNNTIDSLLTMTVLFAAWSMIIAVERDETKWLYLSMFILGLGYNIKTLEAFLVLPALWLVYLAAGRRSIKYRLLNLAGSSLLLLAIALSWSILVDLTPENERPYVGSSETNSELELATGYNGLMHFLGKGVRVPGVNPNAQHTPGTRNMDRITPGSTVSDPSGGPGTPGPMPVPNGSDGRGPGGTRMAFFSFETGNPGIFRLFQRQISGQISWLLPLGLFGFITSLLRRRTDSASSGEAKKISLLLWGGWLLPQLLFFSIAIDYHRYYLVMMAPALAALVGIGLKELFDIFQSNHRNRWLLPFAIILNLVVEAAIAWQFDEWRSWLLPILGISDVIALSLLLIALRKPSFLHISMIIAAIAMLIPQVIWALTPIVYGGSSILPYAGPELDPKVAQRNVRGMAMPKLPSNERNSDVIKLERFLLDNRHGEKFLLAVGNANEASQIILDTGQAVMTVGGFMGMEKILTASEFEQMVNQGKVRYVLVSSMFANSQPELNAWVISHGKAVPSRLWQEPQHYASTTDPQKPVNAMTALYQSRRLFDCAPIK